MHHQNTILHSILKHVPWHVFDRLVDAHGADASVRVRCNAQPCRMQMRRGKRVPEDIAVASHGDLDLGRNRGLGFTTLEVPGLKSAKRQHA